MHKKTMNYRERIQQNGRAANPFFCLMDIDVVSAGNGEAELAMQVRPDMHNGVGWLQGGMLVALADEAMALAIYTQLSDGEGIATISESTSFLRGIRKGSITAEGRVIRKGRRVAFCEAEVWADNGGERFLLSRTSAAFTVTKETK
ncbi:PaaI family thioesterase [Methanoregula sp.]|uniref:PaaI family thioesterase n=1 Tax=Methanoregula sp. TaxID=2052170 RepID=UPI0026054BD4|nr:PaaI family thioesterase [Methanoregula sp.]MDD5142704.1 PaaI family thioesterase [Methanoregula sp.]